MMMYHKELEKFMPFLIGMAIISTTLNALSNYFGIDRVAYNLLAVFLFSIFWYGFFELAKK